MIDYQSAEKTALPHLFLDYGLPINALIKNKFKSIELSLWKEFMSGKITRNELRSRRFDDTFMHFGIEVNGEEMDKKLRKMHANYVHVFPDASEVVKNIAHNYELHIVTNGDFITQTKKINATGLKTYFKHIFISGVIGYRKPEFEFFDFVLSKINAKSTDCCIIGDSLQADIFGGNRMGMQTIWHNPYKYKNLTEIKPNYEIHELKELLEIL